MLTQAIITAAGTGLLLILAVMMLRAQFVIVTVEGDSMAPLLRPGDQLVVRRKGLEQIRAGDIVVLEPPDSRGGPGRSESVGLRGRHWVIKRAAALPGEPVPEGLTYAPDVPREAIVPAGRLFVLGDNAINSIDSRAYGSVPGRDVLGVVIHIRAFRQERSNARHVSRL
ncbi:signal peptidase I [Nonomuraea sp. NPDC049400]|uniref:signal peptidase I n=1 Tax=Nonomuraea sp. NPDC049400 TaxID=3364352 RepID=UPI0037A4F2DB